MFYQENPCQHPVIILKDVKHTEIVTLLKFMYQGEVNVRQDDLPNFLKVAQMLQIKGLEGGEGQIIPMLNNYVNVSDPQYDSENVTTLLDAINERENENKVLDESPQSYKVAKRNAKKRKKHVVENDYNLVKELKNEPSVNSKDILTEDNEKEVNDSRSERDNNDNNDSAEIIELPKESNLEENSIQTGMIFYYIICYKYLYLVVHGSFYIPRFMHKLI